MEKFIRTVMLNGSIRAVNLENCLYWDLFKNGDSEDLVLYMNGGAEIYFPKSNHSKISWGKLVNDLENRTNRSCEEDHTEEKSKIKREHIEELAKLAESRTSGH